MTLPDFELLAANLRIQTGAAVVHWALLVTDEMRDRWKLYALLNRFQIDEAFESDREFKTKQNAEFGLNEDTNRRLLYGTDERRTEETIFLDDGTGFHPRNYSVGAISPRGEKPEGSGPFLPLWQRRQALKIYDCLFCG